MTDSRRQLGNRGEEMAVQTLKEAGITVIERNWRCRAGELDIVGQEKAPDYTRSGEPVPWLVFVEVRTRRGTDHGSALQSITARKQAKLREVAAHYVQSIGWAGPWRIDVVGVQLDRTGRLVTVDHIRHAVTG